MASLEIYDTTLRDGSQAEGVSLSLPDKLAIARALDDLGVAWIEGGWPGSNPKDEAFFQAAQTLHLETAKISAFGATRRANVKPEDDQNLRKLIDSKAGATCIVGKTWIFHVKEALRVSPEENLAMIADSVAYLAKETKAPVFFDAEHFFDAYADDPAYTLSCLEAAHKAGAARIVLCDTNGGALPQQISAAVKVVKARLPNAILGIHVHNDGGLGVANTLAAVEAGCTQVQGTLNGLGERCGNADLCSIIANLELKLGHECLPKGRLNRLTPISRLVWERVNLLPPRGQPFTGMSAFAHKGGIHVSAVERNPRTYEHITPESVGNERRILVSELSGRSNLRARLRPLLGDIDDAAIAKILARLVELESQGWTFEAADASFELLARRSLGQYQDAFRLLNHRIHGIALEGLPHAVEASVKLVDRQGVTRHTIAEGDGPFDALWHALMEALLPSLPALARLKLVDFKVRVINTQDGTAAKVRVLIDHRFDDKPICTVGVDENILEASWKALVDAVEYAVKD